MNDMIEVSQGAFEAASGPRVAVPFSPALDRLIGRAAALSPDGKPTLALLGQALLAEDDELSAWVGDKASWIGPPISTAVLARIEEIRKRPPGELATTAIQRAAIEPVLWAASQLARDVTDLSVEPIHVLAACLYTGVAQELSLDRDAWATRFRCFITSARPAQARAWRRLHDKDHGRRLSDGIKDVLGNAKGYAAGAGTITIDVRALLCGLLHDGLRNPNSDYATTLLVRALGGDERVRARLADTAFVANGNLSLGEDVECVFDRARLFSTSRDRRERGVLRARHLLFALFTDRKLVQSLSLIDTLGKTQEGVLAAITAWALNRDNSHEDPHRLREVLAEVREDVFAGYANDLAIGQDQLGIMADVRGLAAVLASREVEPPLSVGLFGEWGSGKSFFMAKLRERIDDLARASRARRHVDSAFCGQRGHVVQIEFNAWHYLDANLWSSLAVRVFDKLSEELDLEFRAECLDKLQSLKARATELESQREAFRREREQLTAELAKRRAQRTESIRFEEYLHAVARKMAAAIDRDARVQTAAKQLGLAATTTVADLRREHGALKTALGRVATWWRITRWPWRLLALVAVTALPVLTSWLAARYSDALIGVAGGLTALSGVIVSVGQAIGRTAKRAGSSLDEAMKVIHDIEEQVRSKESEGERALRASQAEVDAKIAELEREQHGLEQRMREADAQLAQLNRGDERTFHDFIQERVASDTYRKHLGVVSSVHKDFQQLVKFLKPSDTPPNVERIILYIDDLDRCPPDRVVEVLQAIHILLSMPLFVVVVAVDSRWLLDSLATYYHKQFEDPALPYDAARPQQYLEKIFQIPFALRSMSANGFTSLVGSLVAPPVAAPLRQPGAGDEGARLARGSVSPTAMTSAPAARSLGEGRIDLAPRGLQLEASEVKFFHRLAQLGLSPRSTKRFVNLYRIVRSSLSTEQLDRFLRDDYKAVQIALALAISDPCFSAELFQEVLEGRISSQETLASWCEPRAASGHAATALFAKLTDWKIVEPAIRTVARFSFATGRVLRAAS